MKCEIIIGHGNQQPGMWEGTGNGNVMESPFTPASSRGREQQTTSKDNKYSPDKQVLGSEDRPQRSRF